jgi:hypothetical protein
MATRKEFCTSCLAAMLAGWAAPLRAGIREEDVKQKENKEGKRIVGACGIVCSDCPAYIATRTDDDALRARTAAEWSAMYHADIKPAGINCDGCPSAGPRLFAHCLECGIRACAHGRKLVTCAECPDYACGKLQEFFAMVPQARQTLEGLRRQ